MRAGRKKAHPLLRRADPAYQSWTIVDRPQGRENYQDGDRSQTMLWKDRPYLDVEQPHMDADPDIDAEDTGEKPAKRLGLESIVRRAVMELVADSDHEDNKTRYFDMSGAFDAPLWGAVAPLVNYVLDLMRMNEDSDQLKSKVESSSISRKSGLLEIARIAEEFNFGYRRQKKDWDSFTKLVPAVTGLLKNKHNRTNLKEALGQWVAENGPVDKKGFAGAPDEWGFDIFEPSTTPTGDAQEFYEGYIPGAVPRQETFNLKRIVKLAEGDWEDMVSGIRSRLSEKMIVDFDTAEVNTRRLSSLLRYITDQPDSQLAMTVVVGAIVRDVIRQVGGLREDAIKFDGRTVRLDINVSSLLSAMQSGTRRITDEWLSMAISMMRIVGALPGGDPDPEPLRDRMRNGLVAIALSIATMAIQGLHDRPTSQDESAVAGSEESGGTGENGQQDNNSDFVSTASFTVADIAKRIVSPAKVRVVTQDEAEGGIELGDGEILELPTGKRRPANLVSGGLLWPSR